MFTDLNNNVISFFNKYNLEDITKKNVKSYFKNINEQNNYGGILHACVHNKFDEKKVLKLVEFLMEFGIDVNMRGKLTGYTFIHLALYGYTDNNKDYSYSTDFILKLIRLAKKYNFNVNMVDNDKDTLIHTAIASEIYTGKIEPIIDELGIDFKIDSKDNNGNDIYQALLKYKEEAKRINNQSWLSKLEDEEEIIKSRVGIITDLKSRDEEPKQQKKQIHVLNSESDIDVLKRRIEEIIRPKGKFFYLNNPEKIPENLKLSDCSKKAKKLVSELTVFYNMLDEDTDIEVSILTLKNSDFGLRNINKIDELKQCEKILKDKYGLTIPTDICNKLIRKIACILSNDIDDLSKESETNNKSIPVKEELDKTIKTEDDSLENIEKSIINSKNLNDLLEIKKEISSSYNKMITDELIKIINENEEKYLIEIDSINDLNNLINIINNWLSKKEEIIENNLDDLSINELKQLKEEKCNYLKQLREQVLNSVTLQIKNIINSTDSLIENNVLDKETINECISKIIDKKPKTKTNRRGRK